MRQIILDTETSGLDFEHDRIIEVGCLELIDNVYTGKKFHRYYKPDNILITKESEEIHGLNNGFLSKYPTFDKDIDDFLSFIDNSQMIIHNAQFDLNMINYSLKRLSKREIDKSNTLCTLEIAKKKFPGSKNNLNALCRRFDISLDSREKHGALTDSFLLMHVYNELRGGKQQALQLSLQKTKNNYNHQITLKKNNLQIIVLEQEEIEKHSKMIKKIKNSIWRSFY